MGRERKLIVIRKFGENKAIEKNQARRAAKDLGQK